MMKKHLIRALFMLALTTIALTATASAAGKGFYPDGKIKWEYLFQDGEISEAKWYNEAGQLVSREIYAAGQPEKTEGYRPDGTLEWQVRQLGENRQEVTRFNETGLITIRHQTLGGQPDGEYVTFYTDGPVDFDSGAQAKQSVTYRQGVLEGPARTFFSSGQVEHEFAYSNGEVEGIYRTYSPEGQLLSEYFFSAGQLQ
jgi:antitoxin component YwqK of YwqJK toxin-antitoxin module